jgi:hypothetical protein
VALLVLFLSLFIYLAFKHCSLIKSFNSLISLWQAICSNIQPIEFQSLMINKIQHSTTHSTKKFNVQQKNSTFNKKIQRSTKKFNVQQKNIQRSTKKHSTFNKKTFNVQQKNVQQKNIQRSTKKHSTFNKKTFNVPSSSSPGYNYHTYPRRVQHGCFN